MTETKTMIHTYKHTFSNGVRVTARIQLDPESVEITSEGEITCELLPEYCGWHRVLVADIARLQGQQPAAVDAT